MPSAGLHERVLEGLGRAIVSGELALGRVLRMEELETRFRVSRSVVREAVRVLTSMNMLDSRRSVGVTVLGSDQWNPFDPELIRWRLAGPDRLDQLRSLGELRSGIEPIAAELAARRARPEHCGALTEAVIGMSVAGRSGDLETYLGHDIAFHSTLLAASGNPMFSSLSDVVAEVLTGRTEHNLMPPFPEPVAIALHVEVANAIQAGDHSSARRSMEAILAEASHALDARRVEEAEIAQSLVELE